MCEADDSLDPFNGSDKGWEEHTVLKRKGTYCGEERRREGRREKDKRHTIAEEQECNRANEKTHNRIASVHE